jgi:ribosome-associated protein
MNEIELEKWVRNNATVTFVRSQGPGGQNVNKVNTKAVARLVVTKMIILSEEEQKLVGIRLKNRINNRGEILLSFQRYRSQLRNRTAVVTRMAHLIAWALKPKKRRVRTRPHRNAVERRLEEKKRIGKKKRSRRSLF